MTQRFFTSLLLLVPACGAGSDAPEAITVRDSAGVTIVENHQAPVGASLVLEPIPIDLGDVQLDDPTFVLERPQGGVVLVEGWTGPVLLTDSAGRLERSLGREGSGPGEFKFVRAVQFDSDGRLAVTDAGNARMLWYSGEGVLERTQVVAGAAILGAYDDGSLLLRRIDPENALATPGVHRPLQRLSRLTPDGRAETPIASVAGPEAHYEQHPTMGLIYGTIPFSHGTLVRRAGTQVAVADNALPEIRLLGDNGNPAKIVRRSVQALAATDDRLRAYAATLPSARTDADREKLFEGLASQPRPESIPFIDQLHVDVTGRFWVRWTPSPELAHARWSVFSEDGRLLVEDSLPARFRATGASGTALTGLLEDDDGLTEPVRVTLVERAGDGFPPKRE